MKEITIKDMIALVDDSDYENISKYNWCLDKDGYAVSGLWVNGKTKNIKMHQLIAGKIEGLVIDHINHNKLDNRKENLRHITRQANAMHMKKERGIYWNEQRQYYVVQIRLNGKTKHIGCTKNKEDAIKLRQEAEEKYFYPIIKETEVRVCECN